MTDSKKSTNFRMDRLLRDSQSENILQQQPQNNFWPNTPNLTPNISTTSIPPSSFISSSSQQNVYYSPNIYNSINQQHFFNSFNPSSPLFIPNWPTFLSSPSNNNNNNPLATALVQALLQNQFINQIQKQQISSLFQQITPPSINSTPGTSNSESSGNTNLNNLTSIKYPNNIRSTNVFGKTTNTPLQPKVVEKASQDKNISTRKYVKRVQKKNEIKETPKPRKTTNVLINNNNNVQKAQCDVCGKLFGRPWLLNGHKRIHDGEKPFKCEWPGCTRSFADRSNCRAHEKIHRPEKPFVCVNCGKAFKLKSYLSKHLRAKACRPKQ